MHMLDPGRLDEGQTTQIKNSFAPLMQRDVLEVADELESADRQHFDDTLTEVFGLEVARERMYDSLRQLVGIRQTAREVFD